MQDMILLITGRHVFMLHGDGGGSDGGVCSANSAALGRHIYGVVEWEVDFGLVVWLEIDGDGEQLSPTASSDRQAKRGTSGAGSRASLSLYHFPDLSAERSGDGGGGTGEYYHCFADKAPKYSFVLHDQLRP